MLHAKLRWQKNHVNFDVSLIFMFTLQLDAPVAPGSKGQGYFVSEISDDMRQENRDKLLSVTKDSIQQAAEK